jgi:hypothetical protein
MSKYINHLSISPNDYADNIEKAIEMIEHQRRCKSDYEAKLEQIYNKAATINNRNRLRCQINGISLHEKKVTYKANVKINKIKTKAEKELISLQKSRRNEILESVCTEYQVNIKTIKKIML